MTGLYISVPNYAKTYYFGITIILSLSINEIYNLTGPTYEGRVLKEVTIRSKFFCYLLFV